MENQKKVSEMTSEELRAMRVETWKMWCEYLVQENEEVPTFEEFDKRMFEIQQEQDLEMERRQLEMEMYWTKWYEENRRNGYNYLEDEDYCYGDCVFCGSHNFVSSQPLYGDFWNFDDSDDLDKAPRKVMRCACCGIDEEYTKAVIRNN
jgi:hypothetical protein